MMTVAAGAGGGPLRSESARLPSVTLARAAPGPPVQLRWTTLRVQGPTLRDAALPNDGDGSPPVARGASPPPASRGAATARLRDRLTATLRVPAFPCSRVPVIIGYVSGSSAAGLARSVRDAEVAGSNPASPTMNHSRSSPWTRV